MATEDMSGVRLTTAGGIPYKLINPYPTFGGELDSLTGEEEVIISKAELEDFLLECIPRNNHITSPTFSAIDLPRKMPGAAALSCVKFEVTAVDQTRPIDPFNADPAIVPGLAPDTYGPLVKVHLWYAAVSRSFVRDVTVGVGAEYLHIPPSAAWVSDLPEATASGLISVATNGTVGITLLSPSGFSAVANQDALLGMYKVIPTAEWSYKLQPVALPLTAWSQIYFYLGKLNSRQSTALCENAIVDTVMFTGVSAQKIYTNYLQTDLSSWLIELKFSQRCITDGDYCYTWNHTYSPKKGKWIKMVRADIDPATKKLIPSNPKKFLYESADIASIIDTVIVNNP